MLKMQDLDNGYQHHNGFQIIEEHPITKVEQQIIEVNKVPFKNVIHEYKISINRVQLISEFYV